jgi:tRNA (cytidine/uridine-2'-O-)-methyltransferase
MSIRLALYEPDIPQNTGTILRTAACLGVGVDIIEPCGFVWDEKRMRRAGMDYLDAVDLRRHSSWKSYYENRPNPDSRLVLLTTRATMMHTAFPYLPDDTLLLGRESSGVPDLVHDCVNARIIVPVVPGMRSLNVAVTAGIVLGEAMRQTGGFPSQF